MQKWFFVTGRQRGDFYRAVGSLGVRSDGEAVISPQGGGTGGLLHGGRPELPPGAAAV